MNYGPTTIDGGVFIVQVPAWHSSSDGVHSIGNPCGYIVKLDGVTIYTQETHLSLETWRSSTSSTARLTLPSSR